MNFGDIISLVVTRDYRAKKKSSKKKKPKPKPPPPKPFPMPDPRNKPKPTRLDQLNTADRKAADRLIRLHEFIEEHGFDALSPSEQAIYLRDKKMGKKLNLQDRAWRDVYDGTGGADAVDSTPGGANNPGLPIVAPFDPNDNAHRTRGAGGLRAGSAHGRPVGSKGETLDYTETSTTENESDDYSLFGGTIFLSPKAWFAVSYREGDESAAVGASAIDRKRYMDYRGSMVLGGVAGGLVTALVLVARPQWPAGVFLPIGLLAGVAGGKVLLSDVGF